MKSEPLIGAHVSIAGGVSKAPERAAAHGCTAFQVFTKSPNQWRSAPLPPAECRAFRANLDRFGLRAVVAHDIYLINLASPDDAVWRRSKDAFRDEMDRCAKLGIGALVMHPGSHLGAGEEAGLDRVAAALGDTLRATKKGGVRILLETTAGQGRCLGGPFEHLAGIIDRLDGHPRLGVCFDTCHVFAAGHDLRTPGAFERVLRRFDRVIGIDRIALFHLNDSRGDLGSCVDRHEHIGKGKIGAEAFRYLVRMRRFKAVPKIIETPGGVGGGPDDLRNLDLLFSFAGGKA